VIPYVETVARKTRCRLIDLYTPLSKMPENIPGGVHPNAAGARVMAETVYDAITRGNGKLRGR
jgi:sialate O-acetylesterase